MSKPEDAASSLAAVEGFESRHKDTIAAKMKAGLTREQAIAVIKEQIRHDAALAEQAKASTPAKGK
jgi:hypothetical protein